MKKQPKIEYTRPLTGVEEFATELTEDTTQAAIQQMWESDIDDHERNSCRNRKNKQ
ncbi:hypothetical protein [Alkalihalophilus marmarensis]|uniref:hypothetical protein n=1 Tax=Alkalihalophilus marmarensis TaxID=521377 RepID=UPI002DB6E46D|nr:hypothetical protein [Alkalihalophilus marmarensis]MEC2071166.1 hypothetical protein [Alkalihalophilus marmarensis]